jgi:glycosyltransferase involved in cell wall biosynthesis
MGEPHRLTVGEPCESVRRGHIALLFEYPTLNGGERSMLAVLDRLASRERQRPEFRFSAIAPDSGPLANALQTRGIEVHPLKIRDDAGRRLPREETLRSLRGQLSSLNVNLVHANSLAMGRMLGALGDEFPIRRVAHLRDIIGLSKGAIADLNCNERLVAVSEATREFHVAQGLNGGKTVVAYNGVESEEFKPREKTGALKAELRLPGPASLVLTVGQIGLRKGQDVLADVAVRLRDSHPELNYLVVGERHSNKQESVEFERSLIRRFEEAGIADRLHRLGYRDDVPRLMNEADLLVHPAHQEPLGRVLLEAAASGLPIVATDVGGTREILTDGISARLVPPGDPVALAEEISEVTSSPEVRSRLAVAARERIEARFTIERAVEQLTAVWNAAVGVPPSGGPLCE